MSEAAVMSDGCGVCIGRVKNLAEAIWTGEERQVVMDATSRKDAVARYREKFPESARTPDAICRQFYNMRPDKRGPSIWTPEEEQPILDANSIEDAIADYQRQFPESIRTIAAIRREWYKLRPEKRGEVPCGREKGSTNKTPLPGSAREKYAIPFSVTQNKNGYNNAVNLCRKWDKPYAEALKFRELDIAAKAQKRAETPVKVKEKPSRQVKVLGKKPTVKPTPKLRIPVKVPEVPTQTGSGFAVKQEVVHNGSRASPFFGRVGRIIQITTIGKIEHLMLQFGSSNVISISSEYVVPVRQQEKQP